MKNKKIIILIWSICISPFILFLALMYIVKVNTISENLDSESEREEGMIYFSDIENPKNNLATTLYSADGKLLGEYYLENRSSVGYNQISPILIDALISTEDIRFRRHSGIDVRSLFRAIYGVIIGKSGSGGASTITQQLSKMLFTKRPSSGFGRIKQKLKEWIVAIELEKRYSKNEIIAMYLNRFDWINQAVGIRSASKIYFNTNPDELNLNQSAILVGMLKNPSLYNPRPSKNPEGTKNRRNVVLHQMLKNNKISQNNFDSLKSQPLNIDFQKIDHNEGLAPYFREQLRKSLKEWCSLNKKPNGEKYNLYTDGLVVYTTIDSRIQKHAEAAVKKHMPILQEEFYRTWKGRKNAPYPRDFSKKQISGIINSGIKRSERYKKLKKQGKSWEEIDRIFDKKVKSTLFSWNGEIDTTISPRDSVIYNKFFIHAGMMSMDPKNGHVKAYVGGINHKYFKYDHVLEGKRQAGSTFKPFLYALAMQEGMSPCEEISNTPVVFNADKWGISKDWVPSNATPDFDGLSLTLKFGLANSINIITARIMERYGPRPVLDMALKMGIKNKLEAVPSICLGVFDVTVSEMVASYSTFANQGVYSKPIFITKITDKNGVILEEFFTEQNEALSEKTSALMINLLRSSVEGVYNSGLPGKYKTRGTAMSLRGSKYKLKSQIGGKTGTTQNHSDGWFFGVTPNLVTGIWTGCEDRSAHFRSLNYGSGSHMALPIFGYFMRDVYDDNKIDNITENDIFNYSSSMIKNWANNQMNCKKKELNPELNYTTEDF